MAAIIWYALIAIVFAAGAAWVARRVLDTPIGWMRSGLTGLIVFVAGTPIAEWALRSAGIIDDGSLAVDDALAALFLALTLGWMFAVVVITIVALEFLWPTQPLRNPVTMVRDAFRRRDRARRYAQIIGIASRHGFGMFRRRRTGDAEDMPAALVAAMNEAGVTFIKIGQLLSSRDDILPPEVIRALSTLQMETTPIPWSEARAAIEAQLRRPIDEVFAHVDETPMAAASVAQVHTATLRSGEDVVIKIQRPTARAQVATDLDIVERLAADAERHTDWGRAYGVKGLADEFARTLREELDYRIEASNTEMLRAAITRSNVTRVRVPRVYEAYTTAEMLVQERGVGTPLSRFDSTTLDPDEARRIADGLLDATFEQIAVRGVFHADLHAGNILLSDDGIITLIDFGAVGILEKSMRRLLLPMLVAMANEDDTAATDVLLTLVTAPEDGGVDQAAFQHDVGVVLTRLHNARLDENVFRVLIDVMRRHRFSLPPGLLLVFRTLASLEGSLRRILPEYDMAGRALARSSYFARQLVSSDSLALSAQTQAALAVEQLRRTPRRIETLARQLEGGTFTVRTRPLEDPAGRGWVERLLGRLTTTAVGVTLVVAAVLFAVSAGGPDLTPQVPFYPFLGSIVGLCGLLLLLRSLRVAFVQRSRR